jgi:rubrerythrin
MFKPFEILDIAIRIENNAEALYRSKAQEPGSEALRHQMIWMADEEKNHARWFENLKKRIEVHQEDDLIRDMSEQLLTDFLGKASFSLDDAVFPEMTTLDELAATFIEFEKDTVLFYELLQSFITEPESREYLKVILEEEKKHIQTFEDFFQNKQK